MPQWAVASRTPAMGGSSGKRSGASGEGEVMAVLGALSCRAARPLLLLRRRRQGRHALGRRLGCERRGAGGGRRGGGGRGGGLAAVGVEGLDLRGGGELADLGADDLLADLLHEPRLHLIEGRRRRGAAILDLDHMPA